MDAEYVDRRAPLRECVAADPHRSMRLRMCGHNVTLTASAWYDPPWELRDDSSLADRIAQALEADAR